MSTLIEGVKALLARIQDDESKHGGLLTRETIRACDEMRVLLDRYARDEAALLGSPE